LAYRSMPKEPAAKQADKRTKPMDQAPRDGTLIELIPQKGKPFIGFFDGKRQGWADWGDLVPLIRADQDFVGWRTRKAPKGSPKKAV
jgi:hypothetical protein